MYTIPICEEDARVRPARKRLLLGRDLSRRGEEEEEEEEDEALDVSDLRGRDVS